MKPLAHCRLYTFIDTACLGDRSPAKIARQLCDGGSDIIQLRAKGAPTPEILRLAREIQPILEANKVGFVINDHWDIACELGADACHLGQEDFFDNGFTDSAQLATHRVKRPHLGLSTHAPDQALRAVAANPGYIAIGPVYATPTKPTAPAVTLEYVRWAVSNIKIPWFAIGGITLRNLPDVLAAGVTRVCVVTAILNAPDPAQACLEFRKQLDGLR